MRQKGNSSKFGEAGEFLCCSPFLWGFFSSLSPKAVMSACHGDGAHSWQHAWHAWVSQQSLMAASQGQETAGTGPSMSACSSLLLGPEGHVPPEVSIPIWRPGMLEPEDRRWMSPWG